MAPDRVEKRVSILSVSQGGDFAKIAVRWPRPRRLCGLDAIRCRSIFACAFAGDGNQRLELSGFVALLKGKWETGKSVASPIQIPSAPLLGPGSQASDHGDVVWVLGCKGFDVRQFEIAELEARRNGAAHECEPCHIRFAGQRWTLGREPAARGHDDLEDRAVMF